MMPSIPYDLIANVIIAGVAAFVGWRLKKFYATTTVGTVPITKYVQSQTIWILAGVQLLLAAVMFFTKCNSGGRGVGINLSTTDYSAKTGYMLSVLAVVSCVGYMAITYWMPRDLPGYKDHYWVYGFNSVAIVGVLVVNRKVFTSLIGR